MSKPQLQQRLFLVDAAAKYLDISAEVNTTVSWTKAIAAAAPSTDLSLVGVEPVVVAFVRENFDRPFSDTVWSLPCEIFDAIRMDDGRILPDVASPPLRDFQTFFQAVDACREAAADASRKAVFFKVRLARPEKLKVAGGSHLRTQNTTSTVEILQFMDDGATLVTSGVTVVGDPKSLNGLNNRTCWEHPPQTIHI